MFEVINATYLNNYKLEMFFFDNSNGIVDFSTFTERSGLFSALKDLEFFKRFRIDNKLSTIVWENGLDIAPDTLFIKATG